jgi:hypothetical protein
VCASIELVCAAILWQSTRQRARSQSWADPSHGQETTMLWDHRWVYCLMFLFIFFGGCVFSSDGRHNGNPWAFTWACLLVLAFSFSLLNKTWKPVHCLQVAKSSVTSNVTSNIASMESVYSAQIVANWTLKTVNCIKVFLLSVMMNFDNRKTTNK